MICEHQHIETYRRRDGTPFVWACAVCQHKFVPIEIKTQMTDDEIRAARTDGRLPVPLKQPTESRIKYENT